MIDTVASVVPLKRANSLDPHRDPYQKITPWIHWIRPSGFLDFEAKNGRKSLAAQGFDGSTAAHNPEVAGSSPVSATTKPPYFKRNTVVFLIF